MGLLVACVCVLYLFSVHADGVGLSKLPAIHIGLWSCGFAWIGSGSRALIFANCTIPWDAHNIYLLGLRWDGLGSEGTEWNMFSRPLAFKSFVADSCASRGDLDVP